MLPSLPLRRLLLALLLLASPGLGHVPRALADDIVEVAPRPAQLAVAASPQRTRRAPQTRARRRLVARQAAPSRSLRVRRARRASSRPLVRRTRLHLQLRRLLC